MTCVCCGSAPATRELDPRLPDLAVDACLDCRDLIATWVGWMPCRRARHPLSWSRGRAFVRLPKPAAIAA